MATLRSSTAFRLLCAVIGVLSLGLLSMVGAMVYSSVSDNGAAPKTPVVKPGRAVHPATRPKEVLIDQKMETLSDFLYPQQKAGADTRTIWDKAQEEFKGWTLIGLAAEGENKGFAFLQHKPEGRCVVMPTNQLRELDNLEVSQIHEGMVEIIVSGERGTLKRAAAIAGQPGGPMAVASPAVAFGTMNGAMVPQPAAAAPRPGPPPTSTATFRGTMIGGPPRGMPAGSPPSAAPATGPDFRQNIQNMQRQRGMGRNGRSGRVGPGGTAGGSADGQ